MGRIIKSKAYIYQYLRLKQEDRKLVDKSLEYLLQDPTLEKFKRPYLTKYSLRQIHPGADKQLTIFFEILTSGDVFLRWMNDYTCLHDTWGNSEDPCLKSLVSFMSSSKNEIYQKEIHEPVFKYDPKHGSPVFIRLDKLGMRIHANPYFNGSEIISESIGIYDLDGEDREEIVEFLDFELFFKLLADLFRKENLKKFSFQFNNQIISQFIINLALNSIDKNDWEIKFDSENDYTEIKLK